MLVAAEKEVGFNTTDCKLRIEALASPDEQFIFTITKYLPEKSPVPPTKKRLNVKRKIQIPLSDKIVYGFNTFDNFCDFAVLLNNNSRINIKEIAKTTSLYLYKNTYYLIISGFNINSAELKLFTSTISEFTGISHFSDNFNAKILEYGRPIYKKNALQKCFDVFG
jgi:negative regulator of genetic competence, sporulation and motility